MSTIAVSYQTQTNQNNPATDELIYFSEFDCGIVYIMKKWMIDTQNLSVSHLFVFMDTHVSVRGVHTHVIIRYERTHVSVRGVRTHVIIRYGCTHMIVHYGRTHVSVCYGPCGGPRTA